MCNDAFGTMAEINYHMSRHAYREKIYSCTECAFVSNQESALRAHATTHSLVTSNLIHEVLVKTYNTDMRYIGSSYQKLPCQSMSRPQVQNHQVENSSTCFLTADANETAIATNSETDTKEDRLVSDRLVSSRHTENDKEAGMLYGREEINAVSRNAVSRNVVSRNTVSRNAVSLNAVSANAVSSNAVSANAVSANAVSANDVSANAVSANEATYCSEKIDSCVDEGPHICVLCGEEFETWDAVSTHLQQHRVNHSSQQAVKDVINEGHINGRYPVKSEPESKSGTTPATSEPKSKFGITPATSEPKSKFIKTPARSELKIRFGPTYVISASKNKSGPTSVHQLYARSIHTSACQTPAASRHQNTISYSNRHSVLIQNGQKRHLCPYKDCNRSFLYTADLNAHMVYHVSYACSWCPCKFKTQSLLKVHMRNHIGVSYACSWCPRKFKTQSLLNIHTKTHTEENPWVWRDCSQCHKLFSEPSTSTEHEVVDTSSKEQPLCRICEKANLSINT